MKTPLAFWLTSCLAFAGCRAGSQEGGAPGPAAPDPARGEVVALPPPDTEGGPPLFKIMSERRSRRDLGGRPLTDAELGQLLWAGQGKTSPRGLRTSPSAGALFPMTLYVAEGRGLWRYLPDDHSLSRLAEDDVREALSDAAWGQGWVREAPAVIAVVARPGVTAAKYGDRAERYCALEAGHICQNILLAAEALGLSAVPVGSFRDADLLRALRLEDGYIPYYLIPLGPNRDGR